MKRSPLQRLNRSVKKHQKRLRLLVTRRRFHAYCIGSAKSGTHSIAGLFERKFRAAHEPEAEKLIALITNARKENSDNTWLRQTLLERDRRLRLEMESSQLAFFLLDDLLTLFPEALFILTIRDCYSWLDSVLNNHKARTIPEAWKDIIALRHGSPHYHHSPRASVLMENGFFPLEGYLSYWESHNRTVLERIPAERLLVVRTDRITAETERIANFVGVPAKDLDQRQSHLFRAPSKFGFVNQIDPDFLEETIDRFGRGLMRKYFPDISRAEDVLSE